MKQTSHFSTRVVCGRLGISEDKLRRVLRRPGAPRPPLHPTLRVFLWEDSDVRAIQDFLDRQEDQRQGNLP